MPCKKEQRRLPILSQREQEELINQWRYLPAFVVKRYFSRAAWMHQLDFEDMLSIAEEAVVKAARLYNPTKSKFSTYASSVIIRDIRREAEKGGVIRIPAWLMNKKVVLKSERVDLKIKARRASRILSLDRAIYDEEGHEATMADVTPNYDEEDPAIKAEREDTIRQAKRLVDKLPKRQRMIVLGCVMGNRPMSDVGKELGLCRERVRQEKEAALEKLRKLMGGVG